MTIPAIEIEGLDYAIGGRRILRGVGATIGKGEFWSIVGPNGAGKTTLLKCLNRIWRASRGSIRINGKPLEAYSQKQLARQVSYVPQGDGRLFPFSVEEFVRMGRYPHLSPFSTLRPDDEEKVRQAMEQAGVAPFADRRLETLSGGERQNVYIAAALAQGADIVLLDEPTTFLDYRHQAEVLSLLTRINRESGTTIVAVTHDVNHAILSSDHVLALKDGRNAYCGAIDGLRRSEILSEIYDATFHLLHDAESNTTVVVPQGVVS
jgi:iron complex transport system ATP-binding protein